MRSSTTIIYHDRLIKKIPKKYAVIKDITDHLLDFEYIRLSEDERNLLDQALFLQEAESFLMYLSLLEEPAYEQIKDATPTAASKVKSADGTFYTTLIMSNGISVRCDEHLYYLSPIRHERSIATELLYLKKCPEKQLVIFD